jgi:hypothetical protein
VRLVLPTDGRGLPLGYTIVPPNEKEYEPLADLLTGTPAEVVIADKGFWGRDDKTRLAAHGVALLTPDSRREIVATMDGQLPLHEPLFTEVQPPAT